MKVLKLFQQSGTGKCQAYVEVDGILNKLDCKIERASHHTYRVIVKIGKRVRKIICDMTSVSVSIIVGPLH